MSKDCQKTLRLLERYFDGELSARKLTFVEDHLVECPECSTELRALEATRTMVHTAYRDAASELDFGQLWRAIEPKLSTPKPSLWERMGVALREYVSVYKPVLAVATAAAVVAV